MTDKCSHPNKQYVDKSGWIVGHGLCLEWACPNCGIHGFKEIEPRNKRDQAIYDANANLASLAFASLASSISFFMGDDYQDD